MSDDRLLYTIPEAAERLGVGRTSVYGIISRGEIETVNIGRRRLISAAALEAYVANLTGSAA